MHIKILLFGNYNPFTLTLIHRLQREDHQIYLVTGSEKKTESGDVKVFQEYNFSYDSDNISYIIENIGADIAIFTGAINDSIDLQNSPKDISDYLAGVTNIVLYLNKSNIKQLIYISSLSIFSGNRDVLIDESTKPIPIETRENTLLIGEEICIKYDKERKFKVSILRFSQIYGNYKNNYLKNNICTKMCEKLLKNENIQVLNNKKHDLLYLDDVVDGLYKSIDLNGKGYEIYHIGPEKTEIYSELEILNSIKNLIKDKKNIRIGVNSEEVINNEYNMSKIKELGFRKKYDIDDKVEELYNAIKDSKNNKGILENDKSSPIYDLFRLEGKIKKRIFPFFENLIFFILLNILIFFTKDMIFHGVIDAYLIYVVIIALIYGYEQTLFASILSVVFKIYITFSWDVEALALTDHYMYMWILELFTVGTLVGYLKEQYKMKDLDMKQENTHLNLQLRELKEINKSNQEIKNLYENRLLNYKDSFGRIYEIVSQLDMLEPKAIIFKSIKVISQIMKTPDVSIYISGGDSNFFRLVASSSEKSKTLKNSLKTSDHVELFEKLQTGNIYINKELDPNYPMMAGGIYKNERLQSIIMIWSLPFESNNLYEMNTLGVLSKLIESNLNRGYEYIQGIKRSYDSQYNNVLDEESFKEIIELYKTGVEESIVEFSILKVEKNTNISEKELLEEVRSKLRETDYIGIYNNGDISILLDNTNKKGTLYVINRLKSNGVYVKEDDIVEN